MGRESLQTMILGRKQDWEQSQITSWPSQLEAPEEMIPLIVITILVEVPHWAEMTGSGTPSLAEGCLGRAGTVVSARRLG